MKKDKFKRKWSLRLKGMIAIVLVTTLNMTLPLALQPAMAEETELLTETEEKKGILKSAGGWIADRADDVGEAASGAGKWVGDMFICLQIWKQQGKSAAGAGHNQKSQLRSEAAV